VSAGCGVAMVSKLRLLLIHNFLLLLCFSTAAPHARAHVPLERFYRCWHNEVHIQSVYPHSLPHSAVTTSTRRSCRRRQCPRRRWCSCCLRSKNQPRLRSPLLHHYQACPSTTTPSMGRCRMARGFPSRSAPLPRLRMFQSC
jgi:hypothetical protein